ncbi:MAG: hypothetical protein K8U57_16695 [Planctomycetes bacterium]|nr:hypothetical protein [Planctomycetota bacterium]
MATRWWVAAALAVGTMVGLNGDGFPQGPPPFGGKGPPGGGKGALGGGYGNGPQAGYSAKDQTAVRQEAAAIMQTAQSEARRLAAQLKGPVVKAAPKLETPLDEASALTAVITANGGKIPATGTQLQQTLAQLGDFVQLPVPFSAVSLESGLANPRVLVTSKVGPLSTTAPNRPNLNGRLFLAVNMEKPVIGAPQVRSIEFISWNPRRMKFDFGVIEDVGGDPQIRVLDGVRCFSCHKNRGPILGNGPWSNTTHNDVVRRATELAFLPATGVPRFGPQDRIDGMALFTAQAPEVDAAVRMGASLSLNREGFRLLSRDVQGRKALVALLVGITSAGTLEKIDRDTAVEANNLLARQFPTLASDWVTIRKAEKSSVLLDFSPAGSVGNGGGAWSGSAELVGKYDVGRILGDHGLVSRAQPSNPNAFLRLPVKAPIQPSQIVSTASLARSIGLSEGDRAFLAKSLIDAAKRVNKPKVVVATLARQVFEGPSFQDALEGGILPDREDFKDRFVKGLDEVLRETHGIPAGFAPNREQYASSSVFAPSQGKAEVEPRVIPTTACLRCHEVRGEGRARFAEPLPALAFDPFDKKSREAWLKGADRFRQQEVLTRLLQRVGVDKDMPPLDEPEHELFRANDPAKLDEVKLFLETALKDAKGK